MGKCDERNQILEVSGLRAETEDGMVLFNDVNFNVEKGGTG